MDSLHGFLFQSVNFNVRLGNDQMDTVSSEISSAIHQIVASGTALLAASRNPDPTPVPNPVPAPKLEVEEETPETADGDGDFEIVEMDSVELLAEQVHFCEICGKGFKRDANLRMHMRAHGNRFKTREALTKPENTNGSDPNSGSSSSSRRRRIRFSCPYIGCNRNRGHEKFRALKSAVSVKNHFKRSHCPKMFSCNRCKKKSFSVFSDLKNHVKHCGEQQNSRWRCTCGTRFTRKDKLFGHVALFEDGHMPAVPEDEEEEEEEKGNSSAAIAVKAVEVEDDEFIDGLLNGFDSVPEFSLPDGFWSS